MLLQGFNWIGVCPLMATSYAYVIVASARIFFDVCSRHCSVGSALMCLLCMGIDSGCWCSLVFLCLVCCGIAPWLLLIRFCFSICPELTTFGHYAAVVVCLGFGLLLPMLVQHGPVWLSVVCNSPLGMLVPRASLDMSRGFFLDSCACAFIWVA